MKTRMKSAFGASALAAALLIPALSQADVMGSAYAVSNATAGNALIGGSYGSPEATFIVPSSACTTAVQDLCFNSSSGYSLQDFLTGGGATSITGSSSALSAPLSDGSTTGTILVFTGNITVHSGETFIVTHDDGLQLLIGSDLVVNVPGPTAPVSTNYTYTGGSGTFAFNLTYGECCGPPAVLDATLPLASSPVPEPSSLWLLGVGLFGLGWGVRRRRYHS